MKLVDEIIIKAPKDQVYAALHDPKVLKQCIPGCEELIQHFRYRACGESGSEGWTGQGAFFWGK